MLCLYNRYVQTAFSVAMMSAVTWVIDAPSQRQITDRMVEVNVIPITLSDGGSRCVT